MRRAAIRAALAAALVLLNACVTRPAPSGPTNGTLSSSPSTSPAATVAPAATASAGSTSSDGAASGWTLAASGDPAASVQYRSVAAMADGFVVVGSAGQAGEVALALHSTDGATWTPDQIAGRGTSPSRVLAWGDRAIAVGGGETSRCAHPGSEIDTWVRSADGTWDEADFARVLCSGGEWTTPVILHGVPWLVGEGTADVPFLLQSTDGLSWLSRSDRLSDDVYLEAAAAADTGLWITGHDVTNDRTVALSSTDGARFERRAVRTASGAEVDAMATLTLDGTLVVLGRTMNDSQLVRLTPEGPNGWLDTPVTGFPEGDIEGIQATGRGLVAFRGHESGLPGIWASSDGAAWQQVPAPDETTAGASFTSVAVRNGVAVLVGQLEGQDSKGLVGAIWTAPASILSG